MSSIESFNTNLPSMHRARYNPAAAAVGSRIYIAGGVGESTAEYFDVNTQRWNEIDSMSAQ
eukprot:4627603-Ditylum_brightwellii.AAC.1